jgi:hypothetical protein
LTTADDELAVGEYQEVEVEVEHPGVDLAQTSLGLLGIIHELVRDEAERVVRTAPDHSVRACQPSMLRNVQGGLVRADGDSSQADPAALSAGRAELVQALAALRSSPLRLSPTASAARTCGCLLGHMHSYDCGAKAAERDVDRAPANCAL